MSERDKKELTEREKYFTLLGLVCEKLPYYAANMTAKAGLGDEARLKNVKVGRLVSIAELVVMIRHSLSDFEIPEHLLPEVAEQEAVA